MKLFFALFVFVCQGANQCDWALVDTYWNEHDCNVAGALLVTDDDHVLKWRCDPTIGEDRPTTKFRR